MQFVLVNPFPNDKILDCSEFKAFADYKINVKKKLKFGLGRMENIVGKGEKFSFPEVLKVGIVW